MVRAGGVQFTPASRESPKFTATLDAAKDLRLDPDKEYIVYEFWSKQLIGTFKGKFVDASVESLRLRRL